MTAKSILDAGSGLFDTHVQLEDVQEIIGEQMETEARLGEETKYTVIGDGNGFLSRVILVEPQWTVHDDNLPEKFILKITSCRNIHAMMEKVKAANTFSAEQQAMIYERFEVQGQEFHNREVNLYKILESWNKNEELMSPKVYFSKKFDSTNKTKGILGMELVPDATIRHLYDTVNPHELHPVLKSLAHLQAESLHLTDEQIQSISGYNFKELASKIMNKEGMAGIFEQTRNIDRERLCKKADVVAEFGQDLIDFELICNLNRYLGIKHDVLVHGDLWAANILWKETNGKFSVTKIIDYQMIHLGNPAEDLVRLFMSTLSGKDRQNHWEKLVEQFYEYFLDALGDQEPPYTLEQLKESYRLFFTPAGLLMLPMYGPVAETKISMSNNTEDAELYREILTEKAECLLEDMHHWHLYCKETIKNRPVIT